MSQIIVSNQMYDPILFSTHKVTQSAETLKRLTLLNDFLNPSKFMRNKAVSALQILGMNAQKDLASDNIKFAIVKNTIKEGLRSVEAGVKPNKSLVDIYLSSIDAAKTPKELDKCISKLLKDTISLSKFSLQKTNNGQNGPTHLVSYERSSKKLNHLPQSRNYVVKWSNWNEICTSRLYEVISQTLIPQTFVIPKIAALDFEKTVHENSNGISYKLNSELKQTFTSVSESIQKQDIQVMLMEKVKGSNLIDFAENEYKKLTSDERIDLFQKLGHLAMLDLLMGNTDRLIQTKYDAKTGQYQLEDLTASRKFLSNSRKLLNLRLQKKKPNSRTFWMI